MSLNDVVESELKSLNCKVYFFDRASNSICINFDFKNDEQKMYKELISITSLLEELDINYEVEIDNRISITLDERALAFNYNLS